MIRFITENAINVTAVTTAQMMEIDRMAMEETGPNLYQMMENAGRSLCMLTLEKLGEEWKPKNILILAGTGGNGGGGICAARHLANKGVNVTVCITNPEKLKDVTAFQLHILKSTSAKVISIDELPQQNPDVIIDAIIGYSLQGEPKGNALTMIQWVNKKKSLVISLDVPSGINSTTGERAQNHINPTATLTLALPKTGLSQANCAELYLADIGIPIQVYKTLGIYYEFPFETEYLIKLKIKEI